MVTWLDQAHQRDRADLTQVRQQVEVVVAERDELATRVTALEAELVSLRAFVERLSQIEGFFEKYKEQVNLALEKSEVRRQQAQRDSDRVRQTEIENMTKAIGEVRREVEKFRRYDEEIAARRADVQRLAGEISRLQQQGVEINKEREERQRAIAFLEDQRRQDIKRVAELPPQITELAKKVESLAPRIQYLEQFPPRLGELKAALDEIRQYQNKDLEKVQFLGVQQERQMKSWNEETELFRQRLVEYEKRMEQYAEQHQTIKKSTENLQTFQDQIEHQQHEISELQRLTQNRQKVQQEEWQSQQEQRWQQFLVDSDRQWGDYDKTLAELAGRLVILEKGLPTFEKRWQILLQVVEEDAQMRALATRDWQLRFEQLVEQE
jgi:chromosome segregation ATPase